MASLTYPLTIESGDIVITDDAVAIAKDAIESCIRTKTEERVRNPDYGRTIEPFTPIGDYGSIARSVRLSVEYGTQGYDIASLSFLAYPRDSITGVDIGFTVDQTPATLTTTVP